MKYQSPETQSSKIPDLATLTMTFAVLAALTALAGCADSRGFAHQYATNAKAKLQLQLEQDSDLAAKNAAQKAGQTATTSGENPESGGADDKLTDSLASGTYDLSKIKDCNDIADIKKIVEHLEASLTRNEKLSLIDAIIAPYGKNVCPLLTDYLRSHFALTDMASAISKRLDQIQNLSASDVIQMVQSDPTVAIRAKDVLALVPENQLRSKLLADGQSYEVSGPIVGQLKDDKVKSIEVETAIPVSNLKAAGLQSGKTPTLKEILAAVDRQMITFDHGANGGAVQGRGTENPDTAQTGVKTIQALAQKSIAEKKIIATRKEIPGHLNFDLAMSEAIDQCGKAPHGLMSSVTGGQMKIEKIPLEDVDLEAMKQLGKKATPDGKASFAKENLPSPPSSAPGYFWSLTKNPTCTNAYDVQQSRDDDGKNGSVKLVFSVKNFANPNDVSEIRKKDSSGKQDFLIGYQLKDQKASLGNMADWHVTIHVDDDSAIWLRLQTERVMSCLVQKGFADAKASKESLRAYIIYSLLISNPTGSVISPAWLCPAAGISAK